MDYVSVGIDVSAKKLTIAADHTEFEVENAPTDHAKLIRRLYRGSRPVRVCLESTGIYGLDLALALQRARGIEVMVLNPRIARRFAEALAERSKTDPVDARALREYARRMEFVPWSPPASELLQLRALARRIAALVEMRTQEKNRLHAAQNCAELTCIVQDIEVNIRHLDRRVERLEKQAKALIDRHPRLQQAIARIISVKGIALRSAIQVYGELCVLPKNMTARQWVAHAGLDPRHFESGAFQGKTRISKAGNKYLRAALYMPAFNAILHQANVRAFFDHLVGKGKKEMQARVAVMRKLLHAIHGMLENNADFDGQKFFALKA